VTLQYVPYNGAAEAPMPGSTQHIIGFPPESTPGDRRTLLTPTVARVLGEAGFGVLAEPGISAGVFGDDAELGAQGVRFAESDKTVLNAHPGVLDSAAHAVPSELGEDEIKVCVVPRPGAVLTPTELLDFCAGRMARYAVPRYVEFVDVLPKTATERNQYQTLRGRGITAATWDRERAGYQLQRS
jgi:AMP-binding enzyme C-terminal domain